MGSLVRVAILILILTAISTVTVSANAGPHGGYSATTPACAACHRAHTAVGESLLKTSSVEALCKSCHLNQNGANTDVWNGRYDLMSVRLNGGGFNQIGSQPVTSKHDIGGVASQTAWGGASSGQGAQGILDCTSCHNPHGSANYRILRDSDNGYPYGAANAWQHRWDYFSGADIADTNTLDWQDSQVLPAVFFFLAPGQSQYSVGNKANYTQGMNRFCATCHKSYLTNSGSASTPSTSTATNSAGDQIYLYPGTQNANDGNGDIARFRHAVSIPYTQTPQWALRLSIAGDDPYNGDDPENPTGVGLRREGFVCTTCHFAHGTTAAYTGYAANVAPTNDSALLYYPNRGVCNACHQQGK